MPDGKGSDVEMESENEDDGVVSYKQKYRQLKSRLKYLVYEHECFENDIQKAQTRLLQLSRDKSFLLDQLMRYEAVVLSGEEEETDYSSGEEEALLQSANAPPTSEPVKTDTTPNRSEPADQQAKSLQTPSQLTKQGIAKATAILNSITATTASRPLNPKAGGARKPSKASTNKVSAVAAAKITKAVARARHQPPSLSTAASPLIVSLPLSVTLKARNKQPQPAPKPPQMTSVPSTSSTAAILASITTGSTGGQRVEIVPVPSLPNTQQLPQKAVAPKVTVVGSAQPVSKGIAVKLGEGRAGGGGGGRGGGGGGGVVGSPDSSSSSSSSSSDSDDSGSESSSSSSSNEGEAMETGGPVSIVKSVPIPAGAPQLVRPKAISSPVKAPPQLIPSLEVLSSSSPPQGSLLSPLTSPSTGPHSQASRFLWSNRSSGDGQAPPATGFTSIAPALQSPTALTKPSSGSAFQLVTSPPGSAPLHRPPSLQDITGADTGKPHPSSS